MKTIVITGGTGSFGKGFVKLLLEATDWHIRVFSRDEHKQRAMRETVPADRVAFYIGDVRDRERLTDAFDNADYVVHAAALKQAPLGEIEPWEFISTNTIGAKNVVSAARAAGVSKCLLISTDKALEPINLYGATKMCAERIFADADRMRGTSKTRFAFTRYGNVVGTAGSVVPLFASLPPGVRTPICHPEATRFWISLQDANRFVLESLVHMDGGEAFIPQMKMVRILSLARVMRPKEDINIIGLRPGDKLHEVISLEPRLSSDMAPEMSDDEIREVLCR